jgi:putative FmdB family regulatory protein
MPTYEYVCTSCGTPLEVVQSIHDPALTDCPNCEGGRLRKVFGNVGVVFKGSGFYRTDSRGKSSATSPAATKTDKSDKSSDSPGGSAAPAAKGDAGSSSTPTTSTAPASA